MLSSKLMLHDIGGTKFVEAKNVEPSGPTKFFTSKAVVHMYFLLSHHFLSQVTFSVM